MDEVDAAGDGEPRPEREGDGGVDEEGDTDGSAVCVRVVSALREALALADALGGAEPDSDGVADRAPLVDAVALSDAVPVGRGVALGSALPDPDCDEEAVADADADSLGVADADALADLLARPLALTVRSEETVNVADAVLLEVREPLGVAERV